MSRMQRLRWVLGMVYVLTTGPLWAVSQGPEGFRSAFQSSLRLNDRHRIKALVQIPDSLTNRVFDAAWNEIAGYLGGVDTSRIGVNCPVFHRQGDTLWTQVVPYIQEAIPTQYEASLCSPILKLSASDGGFVLHEVLFLVELYDLSHYDVEVEILPDSGAVAIRCSVNFKNKISFSVLPFHFYPGMTIEECALDGVPVQPVYYDHYQLHVPFPDDTPVLANHRLEVVYHGPINDESIVYVWKDLAVLCYYPWVPYTDNSQVNAHAAKEIIEYDYFSQKLTLVMPEDFRSLANNGQMKASKLLGKQRIEVWEAAESYSPSVIMGRWNRFDFSPLEGVSAALVLKKESAIDVDALKGLITSLMDFYTRQFGRPEIGSFHLVEAPVYWKCANYITVNRGLIDHEMAHFWWLSMPLNWFCHGLTEFSTVLYYADHHGDWVFSERLRQYWVRYAMHISRDPELRLRQSNLLTYYLGPVLQHHLRKDMGNEAYIELCRRMIALPYVWDVFNTSDWLALAQEVTGRDWTATIDRWLDEVVLPEAVLTYNATETKSGCRIDGVIRQGGKPMHGLVDVAVVTSGDTAIHAIRLTGKKTRFSFDAPSAVDTVVLDPRGELFIGGLPCVQSAIRYGENLMTFEQNKRWQELAVICHEVTADGSVTEPFWFLSEARNWMKSGQNEKAWRVLCRGEQCFKAPIHRLDHYYSLRLYKGRVLDLMGRRPEAIRFYEEVAGSPDASSNDVSQARQKLVTPFTVEDLFS